MIEITAITVAMIADVRKVLSMANACALSIDSPTYQLTDPRPLTGANVTMRSLPSSVTSLMSELMGGVSCG